MHIFSQSIAFLAPGDQRPSVVSFLTSLRYIFNSSVIPEILSNVEEQLLKGFGIYWKDNSSWYRLFARSDTMQFSPTLIIPGEYRAASLPPPASSSSASSVLLPSDVPEPSDGFMEEILLPLKKNMRYFSCTLQRCEVIDRDLKEDRDGILALLADVRSLTQLEFKYCEVDINEFLSLFLASSCRNQLEHLTVAHRYDDVSEEDLPEGIEGCFQRLRLLRLCNMEHEVALKLIKRCPNLRTLIIQAAWVSFDRIFELVPKLTTLKADVVAFETSHLFTLCDKLPELTSLDLVSGYRYSQLHNIDFLFDKPWMHYKLRVLKVQLSTNNTNEQPKKYDCVKDCLSHFRTLTQLDLTNFGRQVNDENFGHLAHLVFLRHFCVVKAEVTSKGLFELALLAGAGTDKDRKTFFTNLETLEFSNCKLGGTSESPQHLLKFFSCCATNKLEVLRLEIADLSDADLTPELVAEWKRCGIKTLSLNYNNLSYKNEDDAREKKNGLLNLSQLTSTTTDISLHGRRNAGQKPGFVSRIITNVGSMLGAVKRFFVG